MIVACGRLLRVRRPKQTQASAEPEPEQEYEATVVGVVNQTYRFEGTPPPPWPGDVCPFHLTRVGLVRHG